MIEIDRDCGNTSNPTIAINSRLLRDLFDGTFEWGRNAECLGDYVDEGGCHLSALEVC